MAVIGDGSPDDVPENERLCSFCGREPHAYWSGPQIVQVCEDCVIRVLPALMADAILQDKTRHKWGHGVLASRVHNAWCQAENTFYKAAFFSAVRGVSIAIPESSEEEE